MSVVLLYCMQWERVVLVRLRIGGVQSCGWFIAHAEAFLVAAFVCLLLVGCSRKSHMTGQRSADHHNPDEAPPGG